MLRQIPKGTLILIGGAEDRGSNEIAIQNRNKQFVHFEILKELLPKKKRNKKRILEVITTASEDPNGVIDIYSHAFKEVGNEAECSGSGMVIILDGRDITHTNISYAEPGTPLCIENLRVHILVKGNGFLLKERKFIVSKPDLKKEKNIAVEEDKIKPEKRKTKRNKSPKITYNN